MNERYYTVWGGSDFESQTTGIKLKTVLSFNLGAIRAVIRFSYINS